MSEVYAATGFVPPETVDSGLASIVLRPLETYELRWKAEGGWLHVDNTAPHRAEVDDVIVITEGVRTVGRFYIETMDAES